jgi:hypothetical protein
VEYVELQGKWSGIWVEWVEWQVEFADKPCNPKESEGLDGAMVEANCGCGRWM